MKKKKILTLFMMIAGFAATFAAYNVSAQDVRTECHILLEDAVSDGKSFSMITLDPYFYCDDENYYAFNERLELVSGTYDTSIFNSGDFISREQIDDGIESAYIPVYAPEIDRYVYGIYIVYANSGNNYIEEIYIDFNLYDSFSGTKQDILNARNYFLDGEFLSDQDNNPYENYVKFITSEDEDFLIADYYIPSDPNKLGVDLASNGQEITTVTADFLLYKRRNAVNDPYEYSYLDESDYPDYDYTWEGIPFLGLYCNAEGADVDDPLIEAVVGTHFVVNVDNPLTFEQIKNQITATDATEGDLTNKITFEDNTYILVNGKIKVGTYRFTARVSDSSGNTAYQVFYVDVVDVVAPTITATNKIVGNTSADNMSLAALKKELFTFSDNYSENLSFDLITNEYTANWNKPGSYRVTAKVTDSSGNSSTATAVITVNDTTKPTITATNKTIGNGQCLTQAELKALFTYSDDVTPLANLTFQITSDGYTSNYRKPGSYNVVAKVTDAAGNSSTATAVITVNDVTFPTITASSKTVGNGQCLTQAELKALFTYSDDVTPLANLTFQITSDGYTSNYRNPGSYNVVAKVTDAAGNSSTATAVITVNDTTKPTITCDSSKTTSYTKVLKKLEIKALFTYSDDVTSHADLKFEWVSMEYDHSNCSTPGSYNVVAKVTDAAGNSSTATLVITVIDDIAPVIIVPSDLQITTLDDYSLDKLKSLVSVSDAIDGNVGYTFEDLNGYLSNTKLPGNYKFKVTATDAAKNTKSIEFTMVVSDEDSPVISVNPNYVIVIQEGDVITKDQIISLLIATGQLEDISVTAINCLALDCNVETGTYDIEVLGFNETTNETIKLRYVLNAAASNEVDIARPETDNEKPEETKAPENKNTNIFSKAFWKEYAENWKKLEKWNYMQSITIIVGVVLVLLVGIFLKRKRK